MTLYRSVVGTPFTGAGSFWSPDPDVAATYGKPGGHLVWTDEQAAPGRVLRLKGDQDAKLTAQLTRSGIPFAYERVHGYDETGIPSDRSDWLRSDVFAALRSDGIAWIVRLVDPSVSQQETEWIYVGKRPLRYQTIVPRTRAPRQRS